MKKVVVALTVVIGLVMVSSVYAQKWLDMTIPSGDLMKGQRFLFTGEIQSLDPKSQTAVVKVGDKVYIGNFGFAKYEGAYSNLKNLKVGEMITGKGVVAEGQNWVTRVKEAAPGAKPMAGPDTE
ncbi:MAG TPA: hypothetical protein VMT71_05815 [Syntrophorhabdales bacterium]|nr:hypothetical protein [Syntrophorhabdales bacterium]